MFSAVRRGIRLGAARKDRRSLALLASPVLLALLAASTYLGGAQASIVDSRLLSSGTLIFADAYADQIYCVIWPGSAAAAAPAPPAWVCTVTRGSGGGEGDVNGEHVESWRSTDRGASWSGPVLVDDLTLTNSYSNVYLTPSGRIYTMYNRNSDNISSLPDGSRPGHLGDELGHMVSVR